MIVLFINSNLKPMKILQFVIFILFSISLNANNTYWHNSFDEAQKLALAINKPIIIDFWAEWCRPCLKMDSDTWSKKEIQNELLNFIPLKINITNEKAFASQYSVKLIPNIIIIDPFGEIINQYEGYKDGQEMLKILKENTVDLQFLQDDFISFFKEKDGDTALEIAKKYFDLSLLANENIKRDFISLANTYLTKAKKLYKGSGDRYKNKQTINIYSDSYTQLLQKKYEKAVDKLNKVIGNDSVPEENKLIYTFINFVCYSKMGDREKAELWYTKLKSFDNFQIYILKSRKM